jgi:uncharacterized membrane protein
MESGVDRRGYRLTSIDMVRGLVVLIMALDHVRDFVMLGGIQDPMSDPHINAPLFFTRWITHFCAPVFVFLAGTSAGLMAARKRPASLAAFLVTRGLWLILIVVFVISTAFTQGYTASQMMTYHRFTPEAFGVNLAGVYVVWLLVIALMYPLCRWFAAIKARRTDWWLSYV